MYAAGRDYAANRGIIIADTKFEFGRTEDGKLLLIDEVLTPDSSRFWPADSYAPGRSQPSFDKQPLRDWLSGLREQGRWNGEAPGPALPDEVPRSSRARKRRLLCRQDSRSFWMVFQMSCCNFKVRTSKFEVGS